LIDVADAKPEIVWLAASTCLILMFVSPFAGSVTPEASAEPLRLSVKVPEEPAVLVTTISVTTAVVADGTV
jgi:hypothetical protein